MPTPSRPTAALAQRLKTPPRWLLTLAAAVGAVGLRTLLQPVLGDKLPFVIAYPAVVLAASLWGIASGVAVALACAVVAVVPWLPPTVPSAERPMHVGAYLLVTIFISCMGLFGVSLFSAEKRTREIGIRKVLGAGVGNIVLLLSRDFVLLVMLAIFIASPVAWWAMSQWLYGFPYRIPLSLPIFLWAGCCGILIAMLTVSFHAFRAARANPVKSLKTEG